MYLLPNNALIVLVLYNCSIEKSDAYRTLILTNEYKKLNVLIYNNSLEYKVDSCLNNYSYLEIINDSTNPGVSKAYNYGAKKANELKLKWILLLDQDTIFPKHFFEKTNEYVNQFPDIKLFAPILLSNNQFLSPSSFKNNRGKISKNVIPGLNNFDKKSLLNSGLLIDVETFNKIGGYNEKIKLDFSDFYFIYKFKKENINFVLTNIKCIHDLSSSEVNLNKKLIRFTYYCAGAFEYGRSTNQLLSIIFLTMFRTIILSYRNKTIKFIYLFTKHLFTK